MWRPLGFWLKPLCSTGSRPKTEWLAFDRELLAAHLSTRHFRYFLEGRKFSLYTDQNSLVPAMQRKAEPHDSRQQNHLMNLLEYTTDIRPIAGKNNVVVDALSRVVVPASVSSIISAVDFPSLTGDQTADADVARLLSSSMTSLKLELVPSFGTQVWCNVATGVARPLVPRT